MPILKAPLFSDIVQSHVGDPTLVYLSKLIGCKELESKKNPLNYFDLLHKDLIKAPIIQNEPYLRAKRGLVTELGSKSVNLSG